MLTSRLIKKNSIYRGDSMTNRDLIIRLRQDQILDREEFRQILKGLCPEDEEFLYENAREVREVSYGKDVYTRGLIEFSNYCVKNCLYCGIRAGNPDCERYRLTEDQIQECAETGYDLGFRTFVLQGGEDPFFDDDKFCRIIKRIKDSFPDCAVTMSVGEKSRKSYEAFFDAGADRYLLRHETISPDHYRIIHPHGQSIESRKKCLYELKDIGYQVGVGIMIGSPGQTEDHIINDLLFMKEFQPQMVGMGPFIPHEQTPFRDKRAGKLQDVLHILAIVRLMLPEVLLPATTALGTLFPTGRELGIKAGANVVMPNLSPKGVRAKYALYDGKICTGEEAAECIGCLTNRINSTGYHINAARGGCAGFFN